MRNMESSYKCWESSQPTSEVNPAPLLIFYSRHIACQPCRILEKLTVTCETQTQNVGLRLSRSLRFGVPRTDGHLRKFRKPAHLSKCCRVVPVPVPAPCRFRCSRRTSCARPI